MGQKDIVLNASDLVVRLGLLNQVLELDVFSDFEDLSSSDLLLLEGNVSHVGPGSLELDVSDLVLLLVYLVLELGDLALY